MQLGTGPHWQQISRVLGKVLPHRLPLENLYLTMVRPEPWDLLDAKQMLGHTVFPK